MLVGLHATWSNLLTLFLAGLRTFDLTQIDLDRLGQGNIGVIYTSQSSHPPGSVLCLLRGNHL